MSEFSNEGFNAGYKAGVLSERERIIALLEDQLWRTPDGEVLEDFEINGHTPFLIELIRGE